MEINYNDNRDVYYGRYYSTGCIVSYKRQRVQSQQQEEVEVCEGKRKKSRRNSLPPTTAVKRSTWRTRLQNNFIPLSESEKQVKPLKSLVLAQLKEGKNARKLLKELKCLLAEQA